MPAAEVDVFVELVRRLLAEQHPDLAGQALGVLANGWDNMVCTVGADLLARLPRRAQAAELVAHEQRWLPVLSRQSADGRDREAHLPRGAEIGLSVAGYGGLRISA